MRPTNSMRKLVQKCGQLFYQHYQGTGDIPDFNPYHFVWDVLNPLYGYDLILEKSLSPGPSGEVHGYTERDDRGYVIRLLEDEYDTPEGRFSCAHEIKHLMNDRMLLNYFYHNPQSRKEHMLTYRVKRYRDHKVPKSHQDIERDANYFARLLLIPEYSLKKEVYARDGRWLLPKRSGLRLSEYKQLCRKEAYERAISPYNGMPSLCEVFRVPPEAMIDRLLETNCIYDSFVNNWNITRQLSLFP